MNVHQFAIAEPLDIWSLQIAGDRLWLMAIADRFAPDIFREFTPEITQYMFPSPAEKIEEIEDFIEVSLYNMYMGYDLHFVMVSKATGEFLGCCSLHGEDKVRTPELGIWLKQSAQGHGYGREAVQTLVAWVSQHIDLDYFVYPVDRHNIPSRKIPEFLGGRIVNERQDRTPTGKILDIVVYRIDALLKLPKDSLGA
jgi:[ribosomal protein S5]-alanine N-acetyltransferase